MKLITLSSSSKGNGYLLVREDGRALVIECGVKLQEVKRKMKFDLSKIDGVIVTHTHGDHAKHLLEYLAAGLQVYGPEMVINSHNYTEIENTERIKVGQFNVIALSVEHDVPCFSYAISSGEHKIVFITDTFRFAYNLDGVTNWIIEANFDHNIIKERLMSGSLNSGLANRVYQNHMDISTAINIVRSHSRANLTNVTLIHLSDTNSNAEDFVKKMQSAVKKPVYIADKGMEVVL